MTKVWYLYFVLISTQTEEVIESHRFMESPYYSYDSCITAMKDARSHIVFTKKKKAKDRIWGQNTRREFDCLGVLQGEADGSRAGNNYQGDIEL